MAMKGADEGDKILGGTLVSVELVDPLDIIDKRDANWTHFVFEMLSFLQSGQIFSDYSSRSGGCY